jgi:hypothetical protein
MIREIKFLVYEIATKKFYPWEEYENGHISIPNLMQQVRDGKIKLLQFIAKDKHGNDVYELDRIKESEVVNPFIIEQELGYNCGCCGYYYGWELMCETLDECERLGSSLEDEK